MRELPNPLSLFTESLTKNKSMKKTMSERIAPLQKILQEKMGRLQINERATKNTKPVEAPAIHTSKASPISVTWARHQDEVKEAQRLRYKVFAEEMGARLKPSAEGLDVDIFDNFCEHLLVRDNETLKVIGTYRALPPHQAKQMGCLYSDSEFDLTRLRHLRHKMVEVGRSCVHRDYRSGGVIMALWSGLGQYMKKNNYEVMLGCASVQMGDGGHYAASLAKMLSTEQHLTDIEYRVFPRLALPVEELNSSLEVEPPALIKGYLRLGAKICGNPAWDPDFNTADFLTMLRLDDIHPRYAKHFLGD
jgi:putative hemolysin